MVKEFKIGDRVKYVCQEYPDSLYKDKIGIVNDTYIRGEKQHIMVVFDDEEDKSQTYNFFAYRFELIEPRKEPKLLKPKLLIWLKGEK